MINWKKTTEKFYYEMLGVVPPAAMGGGGAFQVGEASDHRNGMPTFQTFNVDDRGRYFVATEPVTFREFKAEFPQAEYYYNE